MKKLIKIILLILLGSCAQLCFAESQISDCPDLYLVGRSCFDAINNPMSGVLSQKHRDINGFILGRDSFEKAQNKFGNAKMWQSGDAATSENKICYFTGTGKEQVVVVFASNSEMSMGAVDEVRLFNGNVAFIDKCSKINITSRKLKTRSGLYTGMPVNKMKSILGKPTEEKNDLFVYSFCDEKILKPNHPLYSSCKVDNKSTAQRCSGVTAGVAHGVVQWLVIWYGADYIC